MAEAEEIAPDPRTNKPVSAFRTIGEAAEELDLPPHVLRFWESKFSQLAPMKRGGGRRYYRPEDMALLRRIRQFLYQEGYTIRGVQKLLNGGNEVGADTVARTEGEQSPMLFPLDPAPSQTATDAARSPRRPSAQRLGSDVKAALAEIRQELLLARALLAELIGEA